MRQRKAPVQARAQATTEALLDATLQVLVRDGYAKLTTTRVAERAGVSVGTLYQYYPDKRSLVSALKIRYFELMIGAVSDAARGAVGLDLETAVRRTLAALVQVKRDNMALTKALRAPLAEQDGHAFMRETLGFFAAAIGPLLASAVPGLGDPTRRATIMVSALEGAISFAVFEHPDWLAEPWFLDELTHVAVGYVGSAARPR